MNKSIYLLPLLFLLGGCGRPTSNLESGQAVIPVQSRPKNIILMIGDGMGLSQISAGMIVNGNRLNLELFPVTGLQKTYSSDALITDSAAGATAFSTGTKTFNGAIGVDPGKQPIKTILEEAEERGLATGLVSTSSITHATPASFIAHVPSRDQMEDIATFFVKTDIDFFVGGGKKYFDQRSTDSRNLVRELQEKGYFVSDHTKSELTRIPIDFDKKFAYFTADSEPPTVEQGRQYLPLASKLATVFLQRSSDKGFFLMVEGSQIDWASHANNTEYIVREMIDFDQAIGTVLAFAQQNKETLVIVTADHETAGFSINPGSTRDSLAGAFISDGHTGTLVPVFAFGPGAQLFAGIYENTAIYGKMRQAWGLGEATTGTMKK